MGPIGPLNKNKIEVSLVLTDPPLCFHLISFSDPPFPHNLSPINFPHGLGVGCSRVRRWRGGDHATLPYPPWPRSSPEGSNHRHSEPSEALSLDRPLLPLPFNGYLLEVRESPHL